MTSPITFPTISPPQLAPSDSGLHDLPQLLLAITHGRTALAQRAQEIATQRQEAESRIAEAGVRTAGDKLRQKSEALKLDEQQNNVDASDLAAKHFTNALTGPGGLTADSFNAAKLAAGKENPKLAEATYKALDALAEGSTKSLNAMAELRFHKSQAGVQETTAPMQIWEAKSRLDLVRQELDNARVQGNIESARLKLDPARASVAESYMMHGVPAGDAYRLAGSPLPDGVPPTYTVPTAEKAPSVQQEHAKSLASMYHLGNALVEAQGDVGLTAASTARLRTSSTAVELPINWFSSPQQRQLVQGYRYMGEAFTHYITGARAPNTEALRLATISATFKSDDPETRVQKRFMRTAIGKAIDNAASGVATPTGAVDNIIAAAQQVGASPKVLLLLKQQRADAAKYELKKSQQSIAAPLDDIDVLLRHNGFITVAPPRP